jgi:hypothetical protein
MFIEAPAMRLPRFRFGEFLLLITLASLITASLAIRSRTADRLSAQAQAMHAYQARVSISYWDNRINEYERYLAATDPLLSEHRLAGCGLRLMPSVTDANDIPTRGKNSIVVADVCGLLSFRVFDGDGNLVWNWAEPLHAEELKNRLTNLWPPHELTGIEKRQVITALRPIIAQSRAHWQAQLKSLEAGHAEAVANAKYHERLGR